MDLLTSSHAKLFCLSSHILACTLWVCNMELLIAHLVVTVLFPAASFHVLPSAWNAHSSLLHLLTWLIPIKLLWVRTHRPSIIFFIIYVASHLSHSCSGLDKPPLRLPSFEHLSALHLFPCAKLSIYVSVSSITLSIPWNLSCILFFEYTVHLQWRC